MRKFVALAMVLVMALWLVGCSEQPGTEPFDLDTYKESVSRCCSSVEESAVHYGNIAQYQNNYWKASENIGGTITTEKLLEASEEWFSNESGISFDNLNAQYEDLSTQYKKIVMTEVEGKEAEEIEELFRTFFTAYMDLRSLVMSPSGSRDTFVNQYNEHVATFTRAQNELLLFLK